MKPVSVVLALLVCFVATAAAEYYGSYYTYPEPKSNKYYTAYWYYKKGYYAENPGKYFDYYCKNYYDNYQDWYGNKAKGIYGYSYGFDQKYNPGYKYDKYSWGGYATFYSYYDAYNWAYNKDYGFYSGYYDNSYESGKYDYDKYFKGVVGGKDTTIHDFKIEASGSPPDIQNIF